MNEFNDFQDQYINSAMRDAGLDYSDTKLVKRQVMDAKIAYSFTPEFHKRWQEVELRDQHPALQELYSQYLTMLNLIQEGKQ